MHDETFAELFTNRTQLTVARIMPVPFAGAVAAAVSLAQPPFTLERRWQRAATGPFGRSDLAPAQSSGRLNTGRRAVPVEVELAPWVHGVTELVDAQPTPYRSAAVQERVVDRRRIAG